MTEQLKSIHGLPFNQHHVFLMVPSILLISLSVLLLFSPYNEFLFHLFNQDLSALGSLFWQWITVLGDAWIAIVLALVLMLLYPDLFKPGVIAIILGALVTYSLKEWFQFPRPAAVISDEAITIIGKPLKAYNSYPSGHTLTAFTLAGLLAFRVGKAPLVAGLFLLACLVGFSRIMVGAHWPADILLGGGLGWLIAGTAYYGVMYLREKSEQTRNGMWRIPVLGWKTHLFFIIVTLLMFTHDTRYPSGNLLMYGIAVVVLAWMVKHLYDGFLNKH